MKKSCLDVDCPERADCCTTVRWRISEEDFYDEHFREWWLMHEGARIYREHGTCYIQWPMRCKNASPDGLGCLDYHHRPVICRQYVCHRMLGDDGNDA